MRVWSFQHVTAWLEKNDLKEYSDAFVKNAISGSELADLTEKDLETLGVKKLGSRKKLIRLIQDMTALKRENSMDVQEGLYHKPS
jgi:SAM domain (Sterile alpha motif)